MDSWTITAANLLARPVRWDNMKLVADFHAAGDRALFDNVWTAYFCSARCPGRIIMDSHALAKTWGEGGQPIISGFHSPVEKEVLRLLLRSKAPICLVVAHRMPKKIPKDFRRPMDAGRMILASPFDDSARRTTAESALCRNMIVAAIAEKVFVAYAAEGSKTETLCRTISKWGKCRQTFPGQNTGNLIQMGFSPMAIEEKIRSAALSGPVPLL